MSPDKSRFRLVAMRRGEWPIPWIWEIFYRSKPLVVRMWGGYFKSHDAAIAAGRPVLHEFLTVHHAVQSARQREPRAHRDFGPEAARSGTPVLKIAQ